MNSEKEFKDALKNKLAEKEFQFDEASWQQASQMLDATREEKKRRPFPYFLLTGILLFISVIGFYILKPNEKTAVKEIASTNNDTKLVNDVTNEVIVNKENNSSENSNLNSSKKPAITKIKKENERPIAKNAEKQASETKTTYTKIKPLRKEHKKVKKENTVVINKTAVVAFKEEESSTPNKASIKTTNEIQIAATKTVAVETRETKPLENIITPLETNTVQANTGEIVTAVSSNSITADPVKEQLAVAETPKKDSLPKEVVKEPIHFISFEAGASYLFGWNNPDKKDANGINPVIGLNYSNVISKPISFSFGIHYTMVRNLSYSSHTVTATRYNFGEESDVMVFTPTTMHYLVAPLRLSYALNSRNVFGLGYNVGYLLNLNSNVEFYGQNAGQKGNSTILKTSGYTQGFKTIDSQLALFYRRNLVKDLWLNAEFIYGLTDIKDDKFFRSNVYERNMGLKLTLIYNLFKK